MLHLEQLFGLFEVQYLQLLSAQFAGAVPQVPNPVTGLVVPPQVVEHYPLYRINLSGQSPIGVMIEFCVSVIFAAIVQSKEFVHLKHAVEFRAFVPIGH